jgi:arylsulfatase A-like enzyme
MKVFIFATLVAAVAVAGAFARVAAAAPKPHIMTVLMDDVGWYDTQINNPNSDATPHIGELAGAGIRLGRHYAYSVCSPTRRSILSGRFPVTLGMGQAARQVSALTISRCLSLSYLRSSTGRGTLVIS